MQYKNLRVRVTILVVLLVILFLIYPTGYFVLNSKNQAISSSITTEPPKGVGAYIINLDRSKERYEYVKQNVYNLGIPVQRISAVEGNVLSDLELKSLVDFDAYRRFLNGAPKKGTVGCSLSHIKAWETFLKSNFEYAIIFEDDVSFDPKKLKPIINELVDNHQYWDINNFESYHRSVPLTIKALQDNQKLVVYLTNVTHTGSYMINRKAALKLLEKSLPIKMPIDHYFTRGWEFGLTFTGVENPRLVYQSYGTSEIEQSSVAKKHTRSMFSVQRSLFQMKTGIIRMAYNMICYFQSFFKDHSE